MKKWFLIAAATSVGLAGGAAADPVPVATSTGTASGLQKAQGTVSNLPGDGAVKADTQPKPDPSGQKASDYKPEQKPLKITEPPPPPKPE